MGKKKEINLWEYFTNIETCKFAIKKACKHNHTREAKYISSPEHIEDYAIELSNMLKERRFHPSPIKTTIRKTEYGKDRDIGSALLFPDCCVAHALAIVLQPRWTSAYTDDSYACIPERGINSSVRRWNMNAKIKSVLCKYWNKVLFALFIDIKGCYHNVDNEKLYSLNRKYCRDGNILDILREMIFLSVGLVIGLYFSQLQINIILTELDRYVKQVLGVKYYFRFMDDILILSEDKRQLHEWQWRIMNFLWYELHFEVNGKRQIFPVGRGKPYRSPDFGGYVYRKHHTDVRKRIKKSFIKRRHKAKSVAAYKGILQHCDAKHLMYKIIDKDNEDMKLSELGVTVKRRFEGKPIKIDALVDKPITILDFEIRESTKNKNTLYLRAQILFEGEKRYLGGGYQALANVLKQINADDYREEDGDLHLETVIKEDKGYFFEGTLEL